MIGYILLGLYIVACLVLILFVLLQPGKADAAAVFGGGVNSAAFGPRGTQTVLAKVTIGAAITFFVIAFLFSTGMFEQGSVGGSIDNVEQTAPPPPLPETPPATEQQPAATPESKPADQGAQENKNAAPPAADKQPEPKQDNK